MTFTQTLAATVLVSACALSTQVKAQENALEQIVSNFVTSALNTASNEIEIQLEKSLLTASNSISIDSDFVPANSVKISDLVAANNDVKSDVKTEEQTDKTED